MTLGRVVSDRRIFIYYCYYSIDGVDVEEESEPANSDSAQFHHATFHQATLDSGAVSPNYPLFYSRDDHLMQTLVAARCSALYFLTNFVSCQASLSVTIASSDR